MDPFLTKRFIPANPLLPGTHFLRHQPGYLWCNFMRDRKEDRRRILAFRDSKSLLSLVTLSSGSLLIETPSDQGVIKCDDATGAFWDGWQWCMTKNMALLSVALGQCVCLSEVCDSVGILQISYSKELSILTGSWSAIMWFLMNKSRRNIILPF